MIDSFVLPVKKILFGSMAENILSFYHKITKDIQKLKVNFSIPSTSNEHYLKVRNVPDLMRCVRSSPVLYLDVRLY